MLLRHRYRGEEVGTTVSGAESGVIVSALMNCACCRVARRNAGGRVGQRTHHAAVDFLMPMSCVGVTDAESKDVAEAAHYGVKKTAGRHDRRSW